MGKSERLSYIVLRGLFYSSTGNINCCIKLVNTKRSTETPIILLTEGG